MSEVRCASADYQARGREALLALGVIAMLRRLNGTGDNLSLAKLIRELDHFCETARDSQIPITANEFDPTPEAQTFNQYFNLEYKSTASKSRKTNRRDALHTKSDTLHFKIDRSGAAAYFADFINSEMSKLTPQVAIPWESLSDLQSWLRKAQNQHHTAIAQLLSNKASDKIHHPRLNWTAGKYYYSIPAFSRASLEWGLLGFSSRFRANNPSAGVYAVFREARGVLSEEPSRLNMIVRDVLWLRTAETGTGDSKQPARVSGYYFSAVDGHVFEIDSGHIVSEGYMQMFGSRIDENGKREKHHFYLTIPATAEKLSSWSCHSGMLCGSTTSGSRSPGAWKLLAIRDALSDQLPVDLETIFKQERLFRGTSADSVKSMREGRDGLDGRGFHAAKLFAIAEYLRHANSLGVLASHEISQGDQTAAEADLRRLRLSLKKLLWSGRTPHIDSITIHLFEDLLNEAARAALAKLRKRQAKDVDVFLMQLLHSWTNLEALQLLASDHIGHETEEQILQFLQHLLTVPTRRDASTRGGGGPNRRI